jgi:hypothetical protein
MATTTTKKTAAKQPAAKKTTPAKKAAATPPPVEPAFPVDPDAVAKLAALNPANEGVLEPWGGQPAAPAAPPQAAPTAQAPPAPVGLDAAAITAIAQQAVAQFVASNPAYQAPAPAADAQPRGLTPNERSTELGQVVRYSYDDSIDGETTQYGLVVGQAEDDLHDELGAYLGVLYRSEVAWLGGGVSGLIRDDELSDIED